MNYSYIFIASFILLLFATQSAAYEFYGANLSIKDSNTIAMKSGVYGYKLHIVNIIDDSLSHASGLRKNDIILSINNKPVSSENDLSNLSSDVLKIIVLRDGARQTIDIDVDNYEKNIKTNQNYSKNISPNYKNKDESNLPPLVFNNDSLDQKYGKTTAAQLARERARADAVYEEDERQYQRKMSIARAIEQQKLQNISCRTSSECGPGRTCLITQFRGQSTGQCMNKAEADRQILENEANNARYNQINRNLNDLKRKTDDIDKNTDKYKNLNRSNSRSYPYGYIPPLP